MGSRCLFTRRFPSPIRQYPARRHLLTLAIETSCDDTSVAVLEKHKNGSATLHFNSKVTSDNRSYGGVYPIVAHESHQRNIAGLVKAALQTLPAPSLEDGGGEDDTLSIITNNGRSIRKKPDFITVTRGPGMRASLISGVDTAKGLAVAWQIPLLGVNHMQAHALTPRMVASLENPQNNDKSSLGPDPPFPFLTLLVSGGHTMLVHSKDLCNHEILSNTTDIAIGDMIDKSARDILPSSTLETASSVMYGPLLETFAFTSTKSCHNPGQEQFGGPDFNWNQNSTSQLHFGWTVSKPYAKLGSKAVSHMKEFSFSGIGSSAKRIAQLKPEMAEVERRLLAKEVMRVSFEHLASRVLFALENISLSGIKTLVVSGGVASNQYLKHVFRTVLDQRGFKDIGLIFPPPKYCTDNAAMIAWTGLEMFEAKWRTDLSAMATRKWSIDPKAEDGGILGIDGWFKAKP